LLLLVLVLLLYQLQMSQKLVIGWMVSEWMSVTCLGLEMPQPIADQLPELLLLRLMG
jgi:hypothetical protein